MGKESIRCPDSRRHASAQVCLCFSGETLAVLNAAMRLEMELRAWTPHDAVHTITNGEWRENQKTKCNASRGKSDDQ